jgi:alkylation response protein AidB-like acyl-CoA dehydrogenase
MVTWQPSTDDVRFLLFDVLGAGAALEPLPAFAEADEALLTQVIEEAGKFVAEVVAPLQSVGDAPGCRFDNGRVITPPGFADAYRAFWQAGWPSLACATEDGGQGLPWVLEGVLYEMLSGANHGWTMAPGLLHGAYECLKHHGSETASPANASRKRWACTAARPACCASRTRSAGAWARRAAA